MHPESAPKLLTSLERKAELIASLGVQELVVIPFDGRASQSLSRTVVASAVRSARAVEPQRSAPSRCRSATTSTSAPKAKGTAEMLASDGRFDARICPLLEIDGAPVSSTRIRELLTTEGDVAQAAASSARHSSSAGPSSTRQARARARLPDGESLPAGRPLRDAGPRHLRVPHGPGPRAAVSIGLRPTFQTGRGVLIEAFVLDFDGDLYGQEISLTFVERLRGEERFDGIEALVEQMQRDVDATRLAVPAGASSEA